MSTHRRGHVSCTLASLRLLVTTATRDRLDPQFGADLREPAIDELARAAHGASAIWLTGGEPTLRADLPAMIARLSQLAAVGLVTDGLALAEERALGPLVDAGLARVRLRMHAARSDAHDWLVGRKGAAKRAVKVARRIRGRGLDLELEARLTRPTTPHLAEVIELAHELGAGGVEVHPVAQNADDSAIALVARHGLIRPHVERAARVATTRGIDLRLVDFPRCALGAAGRFATSTGSGVRCRGCDDPCAGFSEGYVRRFGTAEVEALGQARAFTPAVVRVRFGAKSGIACVLCSADEQEPEPTRIVRRRLVHASELGARVLRVTGSSLRHPQAAALLRETTLLGFERVEVAGEASGLDAASDAELFALSGIDRVDGAFFGPDAQTHDAHVGRSGAFAAAVSGLRRFTEITGRASGAYAVLHDPDVSRWQNAWSTLPGEPRFRLALPTASTEATLAAAAAHAPKEQTALASVLPACVRDHVGPTAREDAGLLFDGGLSRDAPPSPTDVLGHYRACVCGPELASKCPGIAVGWRIRP